MKSFWVVAIAGVATFAGCKGGENAEDAGANIESSEAEVTAPDGGRMSVTETTYNSTSDAGGTLPTDGM